MLNKKETKILTEIVNYINENGFSPTIREIKDLTNFSSTSTVHAYLNKLEEKGYIERKVKSPRALRVIKTNE